MDHLRWKTGYSGYDEEFLDELVDDKELRKAISDFLKGITSEGQKLNKLMERRIKHLADNMTDWDKVPTKDVVRYLRQYMKHEFGEDDLAKALAKGIITGEGFF